jgi:poly(A) polymerase
VLIASTANKEQYMDWVRLVESKIRLLILSLEKNPYINLAHINPQGYQQSKERTVENSQQSNNEQTSLSSVVKVTFYSTYWFIGLDFKTNTDSVVELNLTDVIQEFTDRVFLQAHKNGIVATTLDAKYVKR